MVAANHTNGEELSPRVRGRRSDLLNPPVDSRAIPARAGKTKEACGHGEWLSELSPRVRGRQALFSRINRIERAIPACAGKQYCPSTLSASRRSYPRACGEDEKEENEKEINPELSPRVRGRLMVFLFVSRGVRAIPAHAGNTCGNDSVDELWRIYPRACGEDYLRRKSNALDGAIPARAWKTVRSPASDQGDWSYPRACGEDVCQADLR